MVHIHITYEALFDLLRKERSLEDIQELDKSFWTHVVSYLQERTAFLQQNSLAEQEKTKLQLTNIKRILKELYEHRERKIIALARTVIRMGAQEVADDRIMLPEEKLFFKECLLLFSKYRESVLIQACNAELPDISETPYSATTSFYGSTLSKKTQSKNLELESEGSLDSAVSTSSSEKFVSVDDSASFDDSASSTSSSEEFVSDDKSVSSDESNPANAKLENLSSQESSPDVLVKFIIDIPKFAGRDKQLFGPFKRGDIYSLPEQIANILLKKQKVEFVLATN